MADTAVPQPTFGDNGFVIPNEADVLAGVQTDINYALGGNVNPSLSTPQGQLATTETAAIGDNYALFLWYTQQVDPAYNSGRMQDAIGRIYFMQRIPAQSTVVSATCFGLDDVVIPIGAIAQAQDGNLYICQEKGTIKNGQVTLEFACQKTGPIPCPADSENWKVYQALFGWDSLLTAADGIVGRNVETRAEFETRRQQSVAANAVSILDAIQGSVLAVDGVLDCYVTENVLDTVAALDGGPFLGPHSLYVAVVGGVDTDIAKAIWTKKAPGCGYNGNRTVVVQDPSSEYLPPVPSYTVLFERPDFRAMIFLVVLKDNGNIPTDALSQIQTVVTNAFSGLDNGPRAKIGSTIFASRYYAGVLALGSWAQIVDIQVGRLGNAASISGSVTGEVLTVDSVLYGTLEVGQLVTGTAVIQGTTIAELATGTGGTGTYVLSQIQTTSGTGAQMFLTDLVNDLTLNIDEAPALSSSNVMMAVVDA